MQITKKVHSLTKDNVFKPAQSIVEDVIRTDLAADTPSIVNPANLIRSSNRQRQNARPADPKDLDFVLDQAHIPEGFLQNDIKVDKQRHLIFATPEQLEILRSATEIFMDGTFKVVKEPFYQLFSLHAFLEDVAGHEVKQVPLTYVLMSSKRKKDYVAVFKAMKTLAANLVSVKFVTDFESAIWGAVASVFPRATMRGCSFHWSQALWRQVQDSGLAVKYQESAEVYNYIKLLFALPFLPHAEISNAFEMVVSSASEQLRELLGPINNYIRRNWLGGQWKPEQWSVHDRAIRTNNDCEGWHNRLNRKVGRGNVQMYLLLELLHNESSLLPIQRQLAAEDKLRRYQRTQTRLFQGKVEKLWLAYEKEELTGWQLLKQTSALTGPVHT